MPELPEVEVVRRALDAGVRGQRLLRAWTGALPLRRPCPDFSPLLSRRLYRLRRRGKYLLLDFSHGHTLIWHLGMTGRFHLLGVDDPAGEHEHLRLDFSSVSLRYRDPRRFGYLGVCASAGCEQHPWLRDLGMEPLAADACPGEWVEAVKQRKQAIKPVLMDGRLMVGVGNIYAAESLFRAGIDPRRAACRVSRRRLFHLYESVREVLSEAIEAGGSTIQSFSRPDGQPGYFAHAFAVYGREGKACPRCGEAIRRCRQLGRSTFFCARCQV